MPPKLSLRLYAAVLALLPAAAAANQAEAFCQAHAQTGVFAQIRTELRKGELKAAVLAVPLGALKSLDASLGVWNDSEGSDFDRLAAEANTACHARHSEGCITAVVLTPATRGGNGCALDDADFAPARRGLYRDGRRFVVQRKFRDGTYTGFVSNGKRHGLGTMEYASGETLHGRWTEDTAPRQTLVRPSDAQINQAIASSAVGNHDDAFRIFRILAELGDSAGQYNLAELYRRGSAQNMALAAKWYRRAAQGGHAAAQMQLGAMHAAGEGVARDIAQAKGLYERAAAQGLGPADEALARLNRQHPTIKPKVFAQRAAPASVSAATAVARSSSPAIVPAGPGAATGNNASTARAQSRAPTGFHGFCIAELGSYAHGWFKAFSAIGKVREESPGTRDTAVGRMSHRSGSDSDSKLRDERTESYFALANEVVHAYHHDAGDYRNVMCFYSRDLAKLSAERDERMARERDPGYDAKRWGPKTVQVVEQWSEDGRTWSAAAGGPRPQELATKPGQASPAIVVRDPAPAPDRSAQDAADARRRQENAAALERQRARLDAEVRARADKRARDKANKPTPAQRCANVKPEHREGCIRNWTPAPDGGTATRQ
jgi:hypothetical protein